MGGDSVNLRDPTGLNGESGEGSETVFVTVSRSYIASFNIGSDSGSQGSGETTVVEVASLAPVAAAAALTAAGMAAIPKVGSWLGKLAWRAIFGTVANRAIPQFSSPRLQNFINNLFKGVNNTNKVGDGTTMAAVRNERLSGQLTYGSDHTIKAQDSLNGLPTWLDANPGAPIGERQIAQDLIGELTRAMQGLP